MSDPNVRLQRAERRWRVEQDFYDLVDTLHESIVMTRDVARELGVLFEDILARGLQGRSEDRLAPDDDR